MITVSAEHGNSYSDGTSVDSLPIGTVGKLDYDGDFSSFTRSGYNRLNKSELRKAERVFIRGGRKDGEIQEGDPVIVNENPQGDIMKMYQAERDLSFPPGSRGICDRLDGSMVYVRFDHEGEHWTKEWSGDYPGHIPKNVGGYSSEDVELNLSDEEAQKNEEQRADLILQIKEAVAEFENRDEKKELYQKIDSLAQHAIDVFRSFGYSEISIWKEFQRNVKRNRSYFVEKSMLVDASRENRS